MSMPAYTLKVATPATILPVSVEELKAYIREVDATQDVVVEQCLRAAIDDAQRIQDRTFLTTTYTMKMDSFPCHDTILLPTAPLQSVSSITYVDSSGSSQTLSTDVYTVDTNREPPRITLKYNQVWPDTRGVANDVTITFVAGYTTAASVPYACKLLIMQLAGDYYENRQPTDANKVDMTVTDRLAASGRVWTVG